MNIPDPRAQYGERVSVLNYRKRDTTWELGEVCGLEYVNPFGGGFRWRYTVRLDRHADSGAVIRLCVGDDRIARKSQ